MKAYILLFLFILSISLTACGMGEVSRDDNGPDSLKEPIVIPTATEISVTPTISLSINNTGITATPVIGEVSSPTLTSSPKARLTPTVKPTPTPTTKPTQVVIMNAYPTPEIKPTKVPTTMPMTPKISLLDAVAKENILVVQQHMLVGTNPNKEFISQESSSFPGASAIHLAVITGNKEILKLFIDNGANIEIKALDQLGGTPLQWAAFWGKKEMVEFLTDVGANINAKDNDGCTPLCAAIIPNVFMTPTQVFEQDRASIQIFLVNRGGQSSVMVPAQASGDSQSQSGNTDSFGSGLQNTWDELPKLQNLLIKNFGPYDATYATFGDFKYKSGFDKLVFDFFGMIHNPGQPNQYDNPTFEFKAPADTVLISPISGIITKIEWQPTGTSYKQDDWDLYISPTENSAVVVNVDHIVSIDCDRSGHTPVTCDKPLKIAGQIASKGMAVEAGQIIGYVGNWVDYNNVGINGRTELTLFKYIREGNVKTDLGVLNHCPTMHLAADIEALFKSLINELMETYETWSGNMSTYNQESMVAPGCIYKAIKELDAKTEPVLD